MLYLIKIGSRVRVVEDHEKPNSMLVDKEGVVIDFAWNRDREVRNLPVVLLDDGRKISARSLWYEEAQLKVKCEKCGKIFEPNVQGVKYIDGKPYDLSCYWNSPELP